ncbi:MULTISPECIES: Lrp/AsnC family transcriptional regulator [unclassified Haladaptatus]|uniref:Lrp/AsnC family transcriptional regulator n=1 Tax=unclassified Haladaptatus TaxID=2622732 RepID=UPI0023E7D385|nr:MULTISPECIES: Lrp/AsnC ligand binding domain-containing protein [unclassified Haladaptatus]
MVHAFIMMKTAAGKSEQLLASILDMEHVAEAHIVAGNYDIIAEVDAPEVYEVMHTVSSGLRAMEGVSDTKTYISLE